MRTTYKWISMLLGLAFSGCVSKSEMYVPEGSGPDVQPVSVRYLKSLYTGYPTVVGQEFDLQGVVTANDRFGAYRYTLVVQDSTGGIEIKAGGDMLYAAFPVGQGIVVHCQGLTLGSYGGMVSLGTESDDPRYENDFIPESEFALHLRKTDGMQDIRPFETSVAGLTPRLVGSFVALEGVQFIDEETGLSWSDPETDTNRHIVDGKGDTLVVRTRCGADFALRVLPRGSGTIEGILGYFNRSYQLRVINPKNVIMDSPRITPEKNLLKK